MADHIDPATGKPSANHILYLRLERMLRNSNTLYTDMGMLMPWKWMEAYADDTVACVAVVTVTGKVVLLEDDVHLFPSDTLLAQIKLIVTTHGNPPLSLTPDWDKLK